MTGIAIFRHSVRQLVGSIGPALRISAVLWIVSVVIGDALDVEGDLARYDVMQRTFGSAVFPWKSVLPYLPVSVAAWAWTAVGWHRYVLLNEAPGAILPVFNPARIAAYLGKMLQVTLASLLVLVPMGITIAVLSWIEPLGPILAILLILFIFLPIFLVIGVRLGVALPAAALGARLSLGEVWQATRGREWSILLVVALLILVAIVLALPLVLVFQPLTTPAAIWQAVSNWISMMVGLSLTTTLYGHYVEGRPLV